MSFSIDHRQLADEMEIFFFDERIGPGLPVWLPNGVAIRDELESFVKKLEARGGYQRVSSPHLAKAVLYEKSGHLRCFKDSMFPPLQPPGGGEDYFLKPMNCPHHHMVFAAAPRSFRQLPLRIAEYGQVYRLESSGALRGLSRARGLCQNDAHIYVAPEQALDEISRVLDLHEECYAALGLKGYRYRLSLHEPDKLDREIAGSELAWLECEDILRRALVHRGLPYFEAKGEAAFYGPKIDVQMRLANGAEESIASVQLDFVSAERFDLSYVSSNGSPVRPWIVHRAPLGSHERFVSVLLEYFEGQLPGWLCPVQVFVIPVSENVRSDAEKIAADLLANGIRVRLDHGSGSLGKRILFAHRLRPFAIAIIGAREVASGKINVQLRGGDVAMDRSSLAQEMKSWLASG